MVLHSSLVKRFEKNTLKLLDRPISDFWHTEARCEAGNVKKALEREAQVRLI